MIVEMCDSRPGNQHFFKITHLMRLHRSNTGGPDLCNRYGSNIQSTMGMLSRTRSIMLYSYTTML